MRKEKNIEEKITWKDIPGYDGRYQASTDGQIRKVLKSGQTRLLVPYCHKDKNQRQLAIKLTRNGKRQETTVIRLVAQTFLGPCPEGHVAYHVNGLWDDNRIRNIKYIPKEKLGRKIGAASHRRPVVKINASGEPIAFYSSAREASRANYLSLPSVAKRCNEQIKKPLALDGCDYKWDD